MKRSRSINRIISTLSILVTLAIVPACIDLSDSSSAEPSNESVQTSEPSQDGILVAAKVANVSGNLSDSNGNALVSAKLSSSTLLAAKTTRADAGEVYTYTDQDGNYVLNIAVAGDAKEISYSFSITDAEGNALGAIELNVNMESGLLNKWNASAGAQFKAPQPNLLVDEIRSVGSCDSVGMKSAKYDVNLCIEYISKSMTKAAVETDCNNFVSAANALGLDAETLAITAGSYSSNLCPKSQGSCTIAGRRFNFTANVYNEENAKNFCEAMKGTFNSN